ncbi:MAG: uracil-DNA glycosylase [Gemmatimonadetes bacterium]|nr:uracil-DNA glycosylase [Gemmatimonadota bacterium]MBK7783244.1 uracil-DNA glycosylase [Gemmatimonadota bacterium]MBK9068706.1 uracil-DNA glycosylase [Gemmatimonadota bacterium]
MDDRAARYLRQQAELGDPEIVLSSAEAARELRATAGRRPVPAPRASAAAPSPGAAPAVAPAGPSTPPPSAAPVVPPPPAPSPRMADPSMQKWRKDAPPIPGPGLVVEPPTVTLLGDEITRAESLEAVASLIRGCEKCRLCQGRKQTVPGEGNPTARLMCIGEGPGATEDETGRPFVGAAGQLLDQILGAIDCPRESVYIANIVKCRPPQNRKPLPDEATMCLPYLHRQIALVRPTVLLAMGGTAAEWLLGVKRSLGDLRNQVHRYAGIPLVVTYHPAALLRNPNWKKPTWDDVRVARQLLDR